MDSDKDKYKKLCNTENSIPIFSTYWWMDTVCGEDNWDVFLVEKGNQVLATLPYFLNKSLGDRFVCQPMLTQKNGIWINYPKNQKNEKKLTFENNVMTNVSEKIDSLNVSSYNQNFDYGFTNWLPFYWKGFKQTTRYTYVIEDTSNIEEIFKCFNSNVKSNILKLQEEATVYFSEDIEAFYKLHKDVFDRQKLKLKYSLEFLKKLDAECSKRGVRKMIFVKDKEGNLISAVYLVWDENSMYYLMSGSKTENRNFNFNTLAVWESIKLASQMNKKFDFEGSMIQPVAEYFRRFGPVQKTYFNISKDYAPRSVFNKFARHMYNKCSKFLKIVKGIVMIICPFALNLYLLD
ncbi:MAG: GNAT family N-acetyltransferase [Clostridiaceae bacterium]|nr:GNAT family N-acetyltransferase [Clostridiaceae bacterium]